MNTTTQYPQGDAADVPAYDVSIWRGKMREFCVVIPVINEGERIQRLLTRMHAIGVEGIADVIIVDAGSIDRSLEAEFLDSVGVRGLLVKRGTGKLSSQLRCAYAFALEQGYEGIVTIDGNDKDDPDPIARFIDALRQGFDFVQASRFLPGGVAENTPVSRDLAIRFIHAPALSVASGFHWTDTTQGFRAYSGRMLKDPRIAPFRSVFSGYELLAYLSYRVPKVGFRCIELPTVRRYPATGDTPTKISGIRGNWTVFKVLIKACLGQYNP